MKMTEIRQLTLDDLRKRLADEEENLSNLHFQLSTRQLESPIRVRTVRRDIARIKTMIHLKEQEQAAAKGAAPAGTTAATNPETTETKAS